MMSVKILLKSWYCVMSNYLHHCFLGGRTAREQTLQKFLYAVIDHYGCHFLQSNVWNTLWSFCFTSTERTYWPCILKLRGWWLWFQFCFKFICRHITRNSFYLFYIISIYTCLCVCICYCIHPHILEEKKRYTVANVFSLSKMT